MRSEPGDGIVGEQVGAGSGSYRKNGLGRSQGLAVQMGSLASLRDLHMEMWAAWTVPSPDQFPGGPLMSGRRAVGCTSPGPPLTTCSAWSDTAPGRRCGCAGKSPQEVKMMWGVGVGHVARCDWSHHVRLGETSALTLSRGPGGVMSGLLKKKGF